MRIPGVSIYILAYLFGGLAALAQSGDYLAFRNIGLSGNRADVEISIPKAEAFWPNNISKYSDCYDGLITGLTLTVKEPDAAGKLLFLEHIVASFEKKSEVIPGGTSTDASGSLLNVQLHALQNLLSAGHQKSFKASGEDRLRHAALGIAFLARLSERLKTIALYKPKIVSISPANLKGPVFNGMNPSLIKDPVAREEYKKANQEESQRLAIMSEEHSLMRIIPILDRQIAVLLQGMMVDYPALKEPAERMLNSTLTGADGPEYLPKLP